MSPSGILLAGAGASAAILAGAPLLAAAAVGALAWAGRVALALPRRARRPDVNPALVREPWRSLVRQAQKAETRFGEVVRTTASGPLRDRLADVAARVGVAVEECWGIARRGDSLVQAVAAMDVGDLRRQLDDCEGDVARAPGRTELRATAEALREQLASAERLETVARDAQDRLRRLAAELNEAVARAVELSLKGADSGGFQPVGSDVEGLVGELESLRAALDETAST
jgi:hypothetical protein